MRRVVRHQRGLSAGRSLGVALLVASLLVAPTALALTTLAGLPSVVTDATPTTSSSSGPAAPPANPLPPPLGGVVPPGTGIAPTEPSVTTQCGVVLSSNETTERAVLAWLRNNITPRTAVLSAGSLYARLCAEWRPANLALRYDPVLDGTDPARWSGEIIMVTPELRAQLGAAATAPDVLPLLARFTSPGGDPASLIEVRQRQLLPDAAALSAALLVNPLIGLDEPARQAAASAGVDPRVVKALHDFLSSGQAGSAGQTVIADLPVGADPEVPTMVRRVALIRQIGGHAAGTPEFAELTGRFQQYLSALPDARRPSDSGVLTLPSGQQVFQLRFRLPVLSQDDPVLAPASAPPPAAGESAGQPAPSRGSGPALDSAPLPPGSGVLDSGLRSRR